jgi:hypothetical protein
LNKSWWKTVKTAAKVFICCLSCILSCCWRSVDTHFRAIILHNSYAISNGKTVDIAAKEFICFMICILSRCWHSVDTDFRAHILHNWLFLIAYILTTGSPWYWTRVYSLCCGIQPEASIVVNSNIVIVPNNQSVVY